MTRHTRPHGRPAAGWAAIAAMTASALSPLLRSHRWRLVTIVQSLLPWVLVPSVPLTVAAAVARHRRLALTSTALAAAAVAISVPLVRRRGPPPEGATPLAIGHANLLYPNQHMDEVAELLAWPGLDVMTFSEYTPEHAAVLRASPLAARFPHRVERPARLASGTALWSRFPVREQPGPDVTHEMVVADVLGPDVVRVVVIHTQSPIAHFDGWRDDLALLRGEPDPDGPPTVMLGDFNAAWWHPELRDVMATGWRDAHHLVGRGLSASWPVGRLLVPFVRLDHALVDDRLAVIDVADVDVPGSDHRGLVVGVVVVPRP